jgi:hypothetical protein
MLVVRLALLVIVAVVGVAVVASLGDIKRYLKMRTM